VENEKNLISAEDYERFKTRWADAITREEMISEIAEHSAAVQVNISRISRVWKKEEIERLGIEVIDVEWEEV
jgi:hypothetical protein